MDTIILVHESVQANQRDITLRLQRAHITSTMPHACADEVSEVRGEFILSMSPRLSPPKFLSLISLSLRLTLWPPHVHEHGIVPCSWSGCMSNASTYCIAPTFCLGNSCASNASSHAEPNNIMNHFIAPPMQSILCVRKKVTLDCKHLARDACCESIHLSAILLNLSCVQHSL